MKKIIPKIPVHYFQHKMPHNLCFWMSLSNGKQIAASTIKGKYIELHNINGFSRGRNESPRKAICLHLLVKI